MAINPNDLRALIASQGLAPGGQVRIPSEAEREQVARVQGMQVRTEAARMATALLAQRQTSQTVWDKWTAHIEHYIQEGHGAGATPVRTGA